MATDRELGLWGRYVPVAALLVWVEAVAACPFCTQNITLTERIDQAHICYAVEWVSGQAGDPDQGETGITRVQIRHVFKGAEPVRKAGDVLLLPQYSEGRPGEQSLLFGHLSEGEVIGWDGLTPCSDQLFDYLVQRPGIEIRFPERLPYFFDYLEHADENIAVDAYSEFANASYEAVASVAAQFPRGKLVQWVSEPAEGTGRFARIGFYGMVLGLCGGEAEAAALERVILSPGEDFRIGIDGLMAGYLLLRRDAGLDVLRRYVLSPETPSSEVFALQQAVRFVGEYGGDRLSKESLRAALRPLVDDPQFAELVLADLARWEDLTLVDTLIGRYGHPDFSNQPTQTAIARYYLAISALDPAGRSVQDQEAIRQAGAYLKTLRERDPELVQHAERFLPGPGDAAPPAMASGSAEAETPVLAVSGAAIDAEAPAASPEEARGLGGRLALAAAVVFAVSLLIRRLWRGRAAA